MAGTRGLLVRPEGPATGVSLASSESLFFGLGDSNKGVGLLFLAGEVLIGEIEKIDLSGLFSL